MLTGSNFVLLPFVFVSGENSLELYAKIRLIKLRLRKSVKFKISQNDFFFGNFSSELYYSECLYLDAGRIFFVISVQSFGKFREKSQIFVLLPDISECLELNHSGKVSFC